MVHVNRLQPHITRDQDYLQIIEKVYRRKFFYSGGIYNRSENQLLDRSHCFKDRTEQIMPPEEERGIVSKSF